MSLIRFAVQSTRQLSTSTVRASKGEIAEGYLKLKDIQASYQKPDGLPVHLKKGATDRFLYYLTFALCGLGMVGAGHLFYKINFPNKDE